MTWDAPASRYSLLIFQSFHIHYASDRYCSELAQQIYLQENSDYLLLTHKWNVAYGPPVFISPQNILKHSYKSLYRIFSHTEIYTQRIAANPDDYPL